MSGWRHLLIVAQGVCVSFTMVLMTALILAFAAHADDGLDYSQITPPTSPYMGGLLQGPQSWAMAGQQMIGNPPGWFGLAPGMTSLWGSGAYDVGQGDLHPATVPYPAMFP